MLKLIAIGSRLMKDDGIAAAVVENIKDKLEFLGFEVIISETDFQYSFHLLKEEDVLVLVDADYTGNTPGSIHVYDLQEAACRYKRTCSQHELSIFDLVRQYSKPLNGYLIGIEIAESGFGVKLSETLLGKFDDICIEVERIIRELVKGV
jgi:hydrogenase maturation protease